VIPVFIRAPEEEEPWPPGAASRWWLHQSLNGLQHSLSAQGAQLILRRGLSLPILEKLIAETGATAVFWNRRYEPAVIARDTAIKKSLRDHGISVETFNAGLLFEPWMIQSKARQRPVQVFAAFWKACLSSPEPPPTQDPPPRLPATSAWRESLALDDLQLEPKVSWAGGLKTAWNFGEPEPSHSYKASQVIA
jgi:deoxyribodipyrimidine photo-lyase